MKGHVEELLRNYPRMVERRDELKIELKYLRDRMITDEDIIESLTFSHPEGERVQTSGPCEKTSKIAFVYQNRVKAANDEILARKQIEYEELCAEIDFLEEAIGKLPDEEREVMSDMVINGEPWYKVEMDHYLGHSTLQRTRQRAVNSIIRRYQSREAKDICKLLE